MVVTVAPERYEAEGVRATRVNGCAREVRRSLPIERLVASGDRRLVAITAPAGYGKTTLIRQWAAEDVRPFACVVVGDEHNDASMLLSALIAALHEVEPFDALRSTRGVANVASILHAGAALAARTVPCVLVLDDVHRLSAPAALLVVLELFEHLPPGSQLVLAGRADRAVDLELLPEYALGAPERLGTDDLALDATEGELLFAATGDGLGTANLETLMSLTEGWVTGLALAAASILRTGDVDAFDGGDRGVSEYVTREVLDRSDASTAEFLLRTSLLDELTASLCDAVTGRDDAVQVLEHLERANAFVVRLDSRGERYRYHRLVRDALQHELHRREARTEGELHRRASAWYTRHGRQEPAIRHSLAARDVGTAAELVWSNAATCIARGRPATLRRWLGAFTEDQIADHPLLALTAASVGAVEGHADEAVHWLWLTQHRAQDIAADHARSLEAHFSLLNALLGEHGLAGMQHDADRAFALENDSSPWRAVAGFYAGVLHHLAGDRDDARACFEDAVLRSAVLWPIVCANCLAELALLDTEDGAWERATDQAERAERYVEERRLGEFPPVAIVPAVVALTLAHRGEARRARESMDHSLRLVKALGRVAPALRAETRAVVGRVSLLSGDTTRTKETLRDLRQLLAAMPDAAGLRDRVAELDAGLQVVSDAIVGPLALTAAELRVLGYLPMHLSISEIAQNLFVSRNTVKSQAIAIYRKLAVSSRGAAVARARELGLLDI